MYRHTDPKWGLHELESYTYVRTVEPPSPAGPLVLGEGDAAVVVAVMQVELPGGAVQHLPPRGREIPRSQLGARHGVVGGVHVDLGEESRHAQRHVEPRGVIDVLVLVVREVLWDGGRLHARRVQPRGSQALPLAVVEAALEVRDDGVERDLVRGGASVPEVGTAQAEAAVGVRVRGWRRRGEVD